MSAFGREAVFVALAVLMFAWPRAALAIDHEVCLYFDIGDQFWDASPRAFDGREFREEFGRNESSTSYPAQRWLARVSASGGETLYGWGPLRNDGCVRVDAPNLERPLTI